MSKTDKTRPWHVRLTETPQVTCVPVHDHRDGHCDLPENPALDLGEYRSCHWAPGIAFLYADAPACGCARCADNQWRVTANRATRRQVKSALRHATRTTNLDPDADIDVDVLGPRRGNRWW